MARVQAVGAALSGLQPRYTLESFGPSNGSQAVSTISDRGAEKVHEFLAAQEADVSLAGLRVGVRGGGCSGFQYQLAFDEPRDGDLVFESHGLKLLVASERRQLGSVPAPG